MNQAEKVINLWHWKQGNGANGAEDRLQLVEKASVENEKEHLKLSHRLYVLTIFIGILIIASVPDLLKLFGVVL